MSWITLWVGLAVLIGEAGSVAQPAPAVLVGRPLMSSTGPMSEIRAARIDLARSQDVFDRIWLEHMGEGITRAAQGWTMTPQVDFEACAVLFIFGGETTNTNGYRVQSVVHEADAMTVRYEVDSFQTSSLGPEDRGVSVRPWAMVLVPATKKTILLEVDARTMFAREPVWRQTAAFPGEIGHGGRIVPGTRQR